MYNKCTNNSLLLQNTFGNLKYMNKQDTRPIYRDEFGKSFPKYIQVGAWRITFRQRTKQLPFLNKMTFRLAPHIWSTHRTLVSFHLTLSKNSSSPGSFELSCFFNLLVATLLLIFLNTKNNESKKIDKSSHISKIKGFARCHRQAQML